MSLSSDAESVEPAAVTVARVLPTASALGRKPLCAAIRLHSLSSLSATSWAPACTMSPTLARRRPVAPASVAMWIHFSHIECRILSLGRLSKFAEANVAHHEDFHRSSCEGDATLPLMEAFLNE